MNLTKAETFIAKVRANREREFIEFMAIVKLENPWLDDEFDWWIDDDILTIDVDEKTWEVDGQRLEHWLNSNAEGDFNSDKWLRVRSFTSL